MLAPLELDRILEALGTPAGLADLGAVLACFGVAWWVDRRVRLGSSVESRLAKIGAGSVNRVIFPLTALLLLLFVRSFLMRWHPPLFFSIAVPLVVALALIRLCLYALHSLFGPSRFVPISERAISFTIFGALILYYLGVLPEIGNTLAEVKLPVGKTEVSMFDLGRDSLVLILAIVASLWIAGFLEQQLMRSKTGDTNARVVVAKLFRALLLLIGVLIALSVVGIDITVLSVFGGALGVGIGLGLQKLASNYIAGFTILLDRSVRIGDMITVDNRFGIVSKATARYVVVRSLDGIEAIVPNETMVTTTVLNHSYTSRDIKLGVPVQVSYDSDLDVAMRLMTDVALGEPRVLRQPNPPLVLVLRFADSGIDLELAVWINDPENGQSNLKSALFLGIWQAFRENDIKIPYPQREVRLIADHSTSADKDLLESKQSHHKER
ncbi:MAG TPA: mechanosensitive ion channel domain-containing protein [Casimicrobiaceae bacterium]|jgi:small-conductance mechanosensitive channel